MERAAEIGFSRWTFLKCRKCTRSPIRRISESEIARSCNVSRQPVREAFINFAEQGLLDVLPQRGTFVRKIAYGAVLDARLLREVIADMRRQVDRQKNSAVPAGFMQLDEAFHRMLVETAGKGGAWKHRWTGCAFCPSDGFRWNGWWPGMPPSSTGSRPATVSVPI
ncbi:MAG: GntR family transcriptional regulator [Rhodovulum sp.]